MAFLTSGAAGKSRLRLGILISGRGSNLQALIAACEAPEFPAEIALVISDKEMAGGLAHAKAAGIPQIHIPHPNRQAFAAAATTALREGRIGLVCLAGFMRLLDARFVSEWHDRLVNIHPSLLPAFPGLHAQRQALTAGVKFAGCTVHFVRDAVDSGPILAQAVVPVQEDDDEDSLSARILTQEHRLYPLAVRLIAEGRVRVADGRAHIAGLNAPGLDTPGAMAMSSAE